MTMACLEFDKLLRKSSETGVSLHHIDIELRKTYIWHLICIRSNAMESLWISNYESLYNLSSDTIAPVNVINQKC